MAKSEAVEMATIGKVDLMRLAAKKTQQRLTFDEMSDAYTGICEAIMECLINGNTVIIQGVGRLIPVIRPGGEGRNPGTGEPIKYEDRLGLKFQVNTNFKLALREVDLKRLDSGSNSKQAHTKGQEGSTGRGGRAAGRTESPSAGRRSASREPAPASRPSRRR